MFLKKLNCSCSSTSDIFKQRLNTTVQIAICTEYCAQEVPGSIPVCSKFGQQNCLGQLCSCFCNFFTVQNFFWRQHKICVFKKKIKLLLQQHKHISNSNQLRPFKQPLVQNTRPRRRRFRVRFPVSDAPFPDV